MKFVFPSPLRALLLGALTLCPPLAGAAAEAVRFEVPVMPELQRYTEFLVYPGYLAIALENIGLSPSLSSRLNVTERGQAVGFRNAFLRYRSRKGSIYSYEAGIAVNLGVVESKLAIPVAVDTSTIASGKIVVTMSPPLAGLIPQELIDRIRIKTQLIASASAQQKALSYLDGLAKVAPRKGGMTPLFESILIEAYNKGGGSGAVAGHDIGDAVPLSDQWLLLLTLAIWLIVVPAVLFVQRFRRGKPA